MFILQFGETLPVVLKDAAVLLDRKTFSSSPQSLNSVILLQLFCSSFLLCACFPHFECMNLLVMPSSFLAFLLPPVLNTTAEKQLFIIIIFKNLPICR